MTLKKIHLYIPDIECDSCTKLLRQRFKHFEGIHSIDFTTDGAFIEYDPEKTTESDITGTIESSGFRVSLTPFMRKSFKERRRDYDQNPQKYRMMHRAAFYFIGVFFVLILIQALGYAALFSAIPDFIQKFGWWLLYLDVSIAAIGTALWYYHAHKAQVTCMTGMMIGMTVGMQIGMMIGAVVAAVNGYFIGAMTGMILGVIGGFLAGKTCGIMGIMEGMMAGVMGGTMGPMISIMMFTDHILWFMPVYMLFNVLIIKGFIYMYFEEAVEGKSVKVQPLDFVTFVSLCVIAGAVLTAIVVYLPKSVLFG